MTNWEHIVLMDKRDLAHWLSCWGNRKFKGKTGEEAWRLWLDAPCREYEELRRPDYKLLEESGLEL